MSKTRRLHNELVHAEDRIQETEIGNIAFNINLISDAGDYQGAEIIITGTGSQASISNTQLVYLDDTEQWRKANGGRNDAGASNILGVAISSSPHQDGVLVRGAIKINGSYTSGHHSGANTFTPTGSQVYMHNVTSGSYTSVLPSGSGEVVRVVGFSIGEDTIFFSPSEDYIEV